MTENIARQPAGIPAGGQFAATAHAESGITLAQQPSYDPDEVAKGILKDLRDIPAVWTTELFYDTHNAVAARKTTYGKFLEGLMAKNHGGRCARHEHDHLNSESFCRDCHVAFMVEARTNPKPQPVPRGVIPVRPVPHPLKSEVVRAETDDYTGVEITVTKKTGDEQFEAAVRRMFNAPDDAIVEVIQEDYESGTDWTRETDTEITLKCGDREASYTYMGDLMRALDQGEQSPHAMALRFMQATDAERPLLKGVAAVYLSRGEYRDPEPVFGKIHNVFSGGSDPSIHFMHTDGREEYLQLDKIVSILETDQSSVYEERPINAG